MQNEIDWTKPLAVDGYPEWRVDLLKSFCSAEGWDFQHVVAVYNKDNKSPNILCVDNSGKTRGLPYYIIQKPKVKKRVTAFVTYYPTKGDIRVDPWGAAYLREADAYGDRAPGSVVVEMTGEIEVDDE